ncbi:hypothetical protein VSH64_40170 [Amycolatopsis rhabdoformis]|uniref:Uncharacterized protein n=1 Tax=Amycolatopsis rhabdoformis TaxID=1448059 RepID=A0ABZ1I3J5_9PSEU|nr:hypothetical protein [Amycolatopsis rhabdoformis]WSE28978.1 hypothetical protein VSH64_40170 [Amycolatopsis rhabdoformis]
MTRWTKAAVAVVAVALGLVIGAGAASADEPATSGTLTWQVTGS